MNELVSEWVGGWMWVRELVSYWVNLENVFVYICEWNHVGIVGYEMAVL